MKHVLFFLLLLSGLNSARAQQVFALKTRLDSLRFRVAEADQRLALQRLDNAFGKNMPGEFSTLSSLRLDDADLLTEFLAGKPGKGIACQIQLSLRPENGALLSQPPAPAGAVRVPWPDATEQVLEYGQTYTLYIRQSLLGAVDCSGERPVFSLKKQLPYYAGAGVGLVAVALGQVYQKQSDDAYANYRLFWEDARTAAEAQPFLQEARDKQKQARIFTYGGLAVVGIDLLLYTHRLLKIRRAQGVYDRFCGEGRSSWRLEPAYDIRTGASSMRLAFSF